jgi:hypothetical protein
MNCESQFCEFARKTHAIKASGKTLFGLMSPDFLVCLVALVLLPFSVHGGANKTAWPKDPTDPQKDDWNRVRYILFFNLNNNSLYGF